VARASTTAQQNQFQCGSSGLTGGGIYFAESIDDASRKARCEGVVLDCEVNLGRVKHVSSSGDNSLKLSQLNRVGEGYDFVSIPRFCVYEPSRCRVVQAAVSAPRASVATSNMPVTTAMSADCRRAC
jgi:hypothetical protein